VECASLGFQSRIFEKPKHFTLSQSGYLASRRYSFLDQHKNSETVGECVRGKTQRRHLLFFLLFVGQEFLFIFYLFARNAFSIFAFHQSNSAFFLPEKREKKMSSTAELAEQHNGCRERIIAPELEHEHEAAIHRLRPAVDQVVWPPAFTPKFANLELAQTLCPTIDAACGF